MRLTQNISLRAALLGVTCLVLVASFAAQASSAAAAPSEFDGISADGKIAVFSTKDQLVPGDTDHERDVYARSFDSAIGEYVTRELSIGPYGGNDARPATFDGMSSNGNEVFFSTRERLVAADADHAEDVYVRILSENRTVLVSQGAGPSQGAEDCSAQNCGNHEIEASFVPGGVPTDGGRAFFGTTEALTAADKDLSLDIYVRNIAAGTTELVSAGEAGCGTTNCGNGSAGAVFLGADAAGDKAYFSTTEALTAEDTDSEQDIYQRDLTGKTTSLVSVGGTCPPLGTNCSPSFGGVSADGSHVFFETREQLTLGDTDAFQDVYDFSGGHVTLVSTGPDGGNASFPAIFAGTTADGSAVYIQTREGLDPAVDTDESQDVYVRSGGTTTLVSVGSEGRGNAELPSEFQWAAPDASVVVFSTAEPLVAGDLDHARDVYSRSGGVTTLVSTGPEAPGGEFDASFAGASEDGSQLFFVTAEPVLPLDHDTSADLYRFSPSSTELTSIGPVGGNGAYPVVPEAVSSDGTYAFFSTEERLTAEDNFAGERDVYGRGPAGTYMVSVGNSPGLLLGPPPPTLEATNPPSPGISTTPTIIGQSAGGTDVKIYADGSCSGEPVAQGTASAVASPGLTVEIPVAAGSTTEFRATAEADGIVSSCSSPLLYIQREATEPPGGGGGDSPGGGTTPTPGSSAPGGTATTPGENGGKGAGNSGTGGRGTFAYVTPVPRITFAPGVKTRLRRPIFRFTDTTGQPGTQFFCRVDKKHWSTCTSPVELAKVSFGRHVFAVKAVNALGTPAAAPLKRSFKVVTR